VPGLLHLGIEQVRTDLEALGYQTAVLGIPACAVDAPHVRQRLWILANSNSVRIREPKQAIHAFNAGAVSRRAGMPTQAGRCSETMANNGEQRYGIKETSVFARRSSLVRRSGWPTEPQLGRVADGIPNRMDRLRALGNAIVPQIAEALGRMIMDAEHWPHECEDPEHCESCRQWYLERDVEHAEYDEREQD
jgi:DNA (cytosine-5)-methyltransferase 1